MDKIVEAESRFEVTREGRNQSHCLIDAEFILEVKK